MPNFTLSAQLFALIFLLSAAPKPAVYQVMSAHPHDVKEFTPFIAATVQQQGRLWLVHLKKDVPPHVREHFRLTDGSDVKHYQAAEMKAAFINPQILEFTKRIDNASIRSDVEALTNFKSRAAGSLDNQKATAQIQEVFTSLGYVVSQQCYRSGACSVIADKPGTSGKVIMLMAHLDSVGKNFAGADDNASGVAVMMEVARVLKDYSNHNTIRFFATNGEENGLLGAEHYAKLLKNNGEIKNMLLAINMDMVGYNKNGIVELETDSKYDGLANWFAELASSYTSLKSKITLGAWGSDHVPFIKADVPTLLTIEDWSTKTPCYHQECDKPNTLNYEYAGEIAKLNMAAIMTRDVQ